MALGVLLLLLVLPLSACEDERVVVVAPVEGFAGLVAADEPHATVVGREVLGNGGTAADAAVAMTFTLAVTYPSRAGLAGGGVCVAYSAEARSAEALVFLPLSPGPGQGTLPLIPRAMAALQARYGSLPWPLLLAPAENLARFGFDMSRALAQDFAAGGVLLLTDPAAQVVFAPGGVVEPGIPIEQAQLASTLSALRQFGAGYFHAGAFLSRYEEATDKAGLPVPVDVLRAAVPAYVPAVPLRVSDQTAWFTPPPAANGLLAAELYLMLDDILGAGGDARGELLHLFLEASEQAFADRTSWLGPGGQSQLPYTDVLNVRRIEALAPTLGQGQHRPIQSVQPQPLPLIEPAGGTGFVVGDRFGNAVACSLTMNGLFGSGYFDPNSGMVLAAPPPEGLSISPVAVVSASEASGRFYFAAAAGDGAAAATSLVRVFFEVYENGSTLNEAMALGRVHHNGLPDVAFVEERVPVDILQYLTQRGHEVRTLPAMGLVNAFWCPNSLSKQPQTCQLSQDPRGFGLAQRAQ